MAHEEQISGWVKGEGERRGLSIVRIGELLARQGVQVPYRTLHRFATEGRLDGLGEAGQPAAEPGATSNARSAGTSVLHTHVSYRLFTHRWIRPLRARMKSLLAWT